MAHCYSQGFLLPGEIGGAKINSKYKLWYSERILQYFGNERVLQFGNFIIIHIGHRTGKWGNISGKLNEDEESEVKEQTFHLEDLLLQEDRLSPVPPEKSKVCCHSWRPGDQREEKTLM